MSNHSDAAWVNDPLGDAISVLEAVSITDPSARPDTEDAHNRVNLALEYLRITVRSRSGESLRTDGKTGTPRKTRGNA